MTGAVANVVVLGGTGFVGRHVVPRLVSDGHHVSVVTRRRDRARHLLLLPTVEVVQGDPLDRDTLVAVTRGATAVVNLIGVLNERGRQTFARAHVDAARHVVDACVRNGVARLLHMSAINADPAGPSRYLRSKGEAEAIVAAAPGPVAWTIFRPSVIFGREDAFLNMFARLLHALPIVALAAPDARFQPVFVGDVAHCFATALANEATIGQRYDLCGPDVYTLEALVRYVGRVTGDERPVVRLGAALSRLQARLLEFTPGPIMSRDNLDSMARDAVCAGPFPPVFGIAPTRLEAVVPQWLSPAAARSPYDPLRARHPG